MGISLRWSDVFFPQRFLPGMADGNDPDGFPGDFNLVHEDILTQHHSAEVRKNSFREWAAQPGLLTENLGSSEEVFDDTLGKMGPLLSHEAHQL